MVLHHPFLPVQAGVARLGHGAAVSGGGSPPASAGAPGAGDALAHRLSAMCAAGVARLGHGGAVPR